MSRCSTGWPRTDVEPVEFSYWCGLFKITQEVGILIDKAAIARMGTCGQTIHHLRPVLGNRGGSLRLAEQMLRYAGLHDASNHQFQVAYGDCTQTVFKGKHFTLFGDANTSIDCVGRLAENSIVNGTATTPNSSTTPMKDGDVYLVASSKFDELDLRLVQF